jgi:hypothetical protein
MYVFQIPVHLHEIQFIYREKDPAYSYLKINCSMDAHPACSRSQSRLQIRKQSTPLLEGRGMIGSEKFYRHLGSAGPMKHLDINILIAASTLLCPPPPDQLEYGVNQVLLKSPKKFGYSSQQKLSFSGKGKKKGGRELPVLVWGK